MCGLVAIVEPGRRPDAQLLAQMATVIAHRGPDGEGQFCTDGFGVHHKRLAIIDPQLGAQPMSRDGVTVAFNGEIYNYVELRAELRAMGAQFRTQSDTEVLLEGWHRWGEALFAKLNGMFAIVLHDQRQGRVVAARDHFGIKPLYRYSDAHRVLYASEIKALLQHPAVVAQRDDEGLADYLSYQFVLGERTLFRGIEKLEPAHYEVLDAGSLQRRRTRYFELACNDAVQLTDPQAIEHIESLLTNAVRRQMRSDVPVGAYLSGGLDSSTVAAYAARETTLPLRTFTGRFTVVPGMDESEHALAVARHIGAQPQVLEPDTHEWADLLPQLAWFMDEPAAGPGLLAQYAVSRAARQHVKVCLGGQGGDEVFGGYTRHYIGALGQALHAATQGLHSDEPSLAQLADGASVLQGYAPLLSQAFAGGLQGDAAEQYRRLIDRGGSSSQWLSNDSQKLLAGSGSGERFRLTFERPQHAGAFKRMLHFDLAASLPALLQVEDRVSMSVSLESRVPLLDAELVSAVFALPSAQLLRGGRLKNLLRAVGARALPQSVSQREDKMGFPVPLQQWIRGAGRDFVLDTLCSVKCRQRGLFNNEAIEMHITDERNHGRVLWGALQLELWHRSHLEA